MPEPRHIMRMHNIVRNLAAENGRFVGHFGDLDVWFNSENVGFIVCPPDRAKPDNLGNPLPNYTCFVVEQGELRFSDKDVEPTPYELCLLYQNEEVMREE